MDSNLTDLGYVEETVFGTTPSAALQVLRRTGGSLRPSMGVTRSSEIRSDLRAGPPIRTSQAVSGQVNVEWSYGTLDDLLEGMCMSDWTTNVLEDGTTKKSYTFEEQFTDPDISPSQYLIFKGCRMQSINLSLAVDSIVTGSFGVMGTTPSIAQASAGTGNTAPTTTEPFNCVDMVTVLREESATLSKVVGVDLRLERSLRAKREIGSLNAFGIGVGRLLVTGSIQQYFENDALMDAWFAFDERSFETQLTDTAGNDLLIHVPRLKYVGDPEVANPGVDSDRMVRVNFEGFADADDDALIRFTRTPA
jgi:hypothetical protein